jgi:DNA-binding PadR family transcriptional regulator
MRRIPAGVLETIANLNPLLHEKGRLAIMTILVDRGTASYAQLRDTGIPEGSINPHTTTLEEAEYLTVTKRFVRKVPRTEYHITEKGREAFAGYVAGLAKLVEEVAG